ncbi:MAG: GNAT family N-acetyltransferase [Thermoguttaceae bacterium]|nr:GNAT family N-acetyltransferase [Thermoguttaceae bacterium]MDW8077301.1 GNAT family N-acetyltransferase [Thermoguttaceae bacterium]
MHKALGSATMEKAELSSESTPLPVKIRVASNKDAEQIKELVFSVMREFGLSPEPNGLDSDLDDIEGNYLRGGGLFEVVETPDGKIVGTAGLMIRPAGVAELRKMYVRKDLRRRGLGKTLLEHMLAHAEKQGIHEVELETNSCLQDAIRLYVKYGFEPIPRKPFSRRCDQVYRLKLR